MYARTVNLMLNKLGCSRGWAGNNVNRKEGNTWCYIDRRGEPNCPRELAECNWGASSQVLGEPSDKWHLGHWLLCWSKHHIPRREVPFCSSCCKPSNLLKLLLWIVSYGVIISSNILILITYQYYNAIIGTILSESHCMDHSQATHVYQKNKSNSR